MAAAAAASGYPQFQPQVQGTMHPGAQPAPGHGVPDFSSWGIDGATAQLGMQLGQNAVNVGQQYMQKNVRLNFTLCTFACCECCEGAEPNAWYSSAGYCPQHN